MFGLATGTFCNTALLSDWITPRVSEFAHKTRAAQKCVAMKIHQVSWGMAAHDYRVVDKVETEMYKSNLSNVLVQQRTPPSIREYPDEAKSRLAADLSA